MTTEQPLLKAEKISLEIGGKQILKPLDLPLYPGELLGIIGPNGAGKTSLLKVLAGIIPPSRGRLWLKQEVMAAIPDQLLARQVAYLEQKARSYWPLEISKVIALGRLPHRGPGKNSTRQDLAAINAAIESTGLQPLLGRNIDSLSEGEKMRVMLARLFATEAAILLADEPTAALDPYHQLLILELFKKHVRRHSEHSGAIVLHDLNLAARFCDRLLLLDQGTVQALGIPSQVLSEENIRRSYQVEAAVSHQNERLSVLALRRSDSV